MFIYQKIRTLISDLQIENKSIRIQDIANSIGVAKGSLENYRDGVNKPTVEVLEKIAVYFAKDLNYFFDNEIINKQQKGTEQNKIVGTASPIAIYEPETELSKCYKIMFEQQKEIADQQKEMTDIKVSHQIEMTELKLELERVKKLNAPENIADVG